MTPVRQRINTAVNAVRSPGARDTARTPPSNRSSRHHSPEGSQASGPSSAAPPAGPVRAGHAQRQTSPLTTKIRPLPTGDKDLLQGRNTFLDPTDWKEGDIRIMRPDGEPKLCQEDWGQICLTVMQIHAQWLNTMLEVGASLQELYGFSILANDFLLFCEMFRG